MRAQKVESPPRSGKQRSFDAPVTDYSSALSRVPAKNYRSNYPIDRRTYDRYGRKITLSSLIIVNINLPRLPCRPHRPPRLVRWLETCSVRVRGPGKATPLIGEKRNSRTRRIAGCICAITDATLQRRIYVRNK